MLDDVYRVFAIDALASSHPLSSKEDEVNTPAEINELFDAITYSKVSVSFHTLLWFCPWHSDRWLVGFLCRAPLFCGCCLTSWRSLSSWMGWAWVSVEIIFWWQLIWNLFSICSSLNFYTFFKFPYRATLLNFHMGTQYMTTSLIIFKRYLKQNKIKLIRF